ncbi:MAG: DapH/DapD/GlmU-related protein [Pseudobdellovibrionaceae bacterium]
MGLSKMKLPCVLRSGSGLILLSRNSKLPANEPNICIEKGTWLGKDVEVSADDACRIVIKSGTTVQDRCKILGHVTIERSTLLAPNVFISSGIHQAFERPHLPIREQEEICPAKELQNHVEEDCWLGINVFVKAGVYIGRGAVVGANSIVLSDVFPYQVIVGVHRTAKLRLEFAPPSALSIKNETHRPYFYRGFSSSGEVLNAKPLFVLSTELAHKKSVTLLGEGVCRIRSASSNKCGNISTHKKSENELVLEFQNSGKGSLSAPAILDSFFCLELDCDLSSSIKIEALL